MVGGTYWQDTVVAKLELEMSELLGFDTIATGTNQALQLPRTTKRDLGSAAEPVVLRLRPGETGLLAGLITTKNTRTREGLTNAPLLGELGTTGLNTAKERNELVIVVRPKVIKFGKPPAATPESGAPA